MHNKRKILVIGTVRKAADQGCDLARVRDVRLFVGDTHVPLDVVEHVLRCRADGVQVLAQLRQYIRSDGAYVRIHTVVGAEWVR